MVRRRPSRGYRSPGWLVGMILLTAVLVVAGWVMVFAPPDVRRDPTETAPAAAGFPSPTIHPESAIAESTPAVPPLPAPIVEMVEPPPTSPPWDAGAAPTSPLPQPSIETRVRTPHLANFGTALRRLLPYYPEEAIDEALNAIESRVATGVSVPHDWKASEWYAWSEMWSRTLGGSLAPELRRASFDPPPIAVFGDLRFTHGREISASKFSADGRRLATADRAGLVRVWDVSTGRLVREFDGSPNIYELSFSASGRRIAALGYTDVWDDALEVWDVDSSERLFAQEGGDDAPLAALFDPRDDDRLWCGDAQGRLLARNVRTRETLLSVQAHSRLLACLAFVSADGRLATAGADGLKLWKTLPAVEPIRTLIPLASDGLLFSRWALAADAQGEQVAFLGPHQKLWLAATTGELPPLEIPLHHGEVQDVAFSPDGTELLVWGRRAGTLTAWSIAASRFVAPAGARSGDGVSAAVNDLKGLLALSEGGRVRLVDSTTGEEILPPIACRGRILALVAPGAGDGTPSGRVVAIDEEGRVCRWTDASTPPVVRRFIRGGSLPAAALSPSGAHLLFVSSERRASIVDLFGDGAPRLLGEGIDPREPLAVSDDFAAWLTRRADEPSTAAVTSVDGTMRWSVALPGAASGLALGTSADDPKNWLATLMPHQSRPGDRALAPSQLSFAWQGGVLRSFELPADGARFRLLAASDRLIVMAYNRSRLFVWDALRQEAVLDRNLGAAIIGGALDGSSGERLVVALDNGRLLTIDRTTNAAGAIDLSRAGAAASFTQPQLAYDSTAEAVLVSDDNGVVYAFPWP